MNAVATPTQPKAKEAATNKGATRIPSATVHLTKAQIEATFSKLAQVLEDAHKTDEPHAWSGDSDRLLRTACELARKAIIETPSAYDAEDYAYDIAALIRAAKLVPGDTECEERHALLRKAADILNRLTDSDVAGQDCCDPGSDRPPLRREIAKVACTSTAGTQWAISALGTIEAKIDQAEALLCTHAEAAGTDVTWGLLRLVRTLQPSLAEHARATDVGAPFDGPLLDLQGELAGVLGVIGLVNEELDDVILHAVMALLTVAQNLVESAYNKEVEARNA